MTTPTSFSGEISCQYPDYCLCITVLYAEHLNTFMCKLYQLNTPRSALKSLPRKLVRISPLVNTFPITKKKPANGGPDYFPARRTGDFFLYVKRWPGFSTCTAAPAPMLQAPGLRACFSPPLGDWEQYFQVSSPLMPAPAVFLTQLN